MEHRGFEALNFLQQCCADLVARQQDKTAAMALDNAVRAACDEVARAMKPEGPKGDGT